MMGRDTNFRYTDLSSAFQDSNPLRYFRRIFGEGDIVIPERIRNQKPILNLTQKYRSFPKHCIRNGKRKSQKFEKRQLFNVKNAFW